MPRRIAVVPLTLRDLGMARSAIAVRLPDDLLSTLTNQPASLYDEFRYAFEHARLRGRLSLLGVGRSITTGPDGSHYLRQAARASPLFELDVIEITDAGSVRVVAIPEHGHIDQVRRRRILPDLGVHAHKVDLFVKPSADPVLAGIGNEVWE